MSFTLIKGMADLATGRLFSVPIKFAEHTDLFKLTEGYESLPTAVFRWVNYR